MPADGYPEETESPAIHIDKYAVSTIKGFKENIKSLEIINDEDEEDDRDLTSVDNDENVLISQDSVSHLK